MIEIGERSENLMTYDEAVMYCFLLGGGWRLPTEEEEFSNKLLIEIVHECTSSGVWVYGDNQLTYYKDDLYHVLPVRDIENG